MTTIVSLDGTAEPAWADDLTPKMVAPSSRFFGCVHKGGFYRLTWNLSHQDCPDG